MITSSSIGSILQITSDVRCMTQPLWRVFIRRSLHGPGSGERPEYRRSAPLSDFMGTCRASLKTIGRHPFLSALRGILRFPGRQERLQTRTHFQGALSPRPTRLLPMSPISGTSRPAGKTGGKRQRTGKDVRIALGIPSPVSERQSQSKSRRPLAGPSGGSPPFGTEEVGARFGPWIPSLSRADSARPTRPIAPEGARRRTAHPRSRYLGGSAPLHLVSRSMGAVCSSAFCARSVSRPGLRQWRRFSRHRVPGGSAASPRSSTLFLLSSNRSRFLGQHN